MNPNLDGSGSRFLFLLQSRDLRFDLRQRRFERCPPPRIRCPLRQNVFALKIQCLFLPLCNSTPLNSKPSFFFPHRDLFWTRLLFGGVRYLLLHRFTFPTARHIFILRGK